MNERWIAVQAWSSGLERGLGLGADVVNGLGRILGAVHGGTGNEHVGPGLGLVGPTCNFGFLSPLSKLVLSFTMLLGRLEIMPLLVLFFPSVWQKK